MRSNHEMINTFEAAAVVMAFVGILIIGMILLASLTPRQQKVVLTSFELLDAGELVGETAQTAETIIDIPNEFYKQFYIAFNQLAILPAEIFIKPIGALKKTYAALGNYSDLIASNYQKQNVSAVHVAFAGEVL